MSTARTYPIALTLDQAAAIESLLFMHAGTRIAEAERAERYGLPDLAEGWRRDAVEATALGHVMKAAIDAACGVGEAA